MFSRHTFIKSLAISFVVLSAVFLSLSSLALSPEDMAELSKTRFGYSPPALGNLAEQKANSLVGTAFLFLSLFFQLLDFWINESHSFQWNWRGFRWAVFVSILIATIAWFTVQILAADFYYQAGAVLSM